MKEAFFRNLILFVLLFSATSVYGQKASVVINQTNNAVTFTEDGQLWGLKINGKQELPPNFKSITYQNGLYILCDMNGDWNVADEKINMMLEEWFQCADVKVSEKYVLFEEVDGKETLIYDRKTWTLTTAKEISYNDMAKEIRANNVEKGTSYDPTSSQQRIAVKQAEKASAEAPFGAFSFRTNSEGKQELIVDGKVMFTADSFALFLEEPYSPNNLIQVENNVDWYKKSGRWAFRVEQASWSRSKFGLYVLDINNKDGQKVVAGKLSIPMNYMGVWHNSRSGYAKCELGGFKEEYRNFNGVLMDLATRKPKE